ncbi:peptidase S8 [Marinicauda salina]|uniref:Peptidase S8 n=1 Tax=Marinicauda salina TaxID=2135793 RepID=A0A2U2BXF4_9PROT|nr:S8 family serine peptidase [Marinicauda salina]PWE18680.1 peptidase S8 [Marinicauda salina]
MKFAAILAAGAAAAAFAATPAGAQQPGLSAQMLEQVRDSYIFVFDNSVAPSAVESRAQGLVNRAGGQVGHVYTTAIRGFSARMPAQAAERLVQQNPNIAYYERDQVAFAFPPPPCKGPNAGDPGCDDGGGDGGGSDPAQQTPWGIERVNGGATGWSGAAWVIDSGIDLDHPDLNVDTTRSANFVSRGPKTADDGNGHGTHVAGTIAAIDNNIGVIGVAPGAPVVAVRVLSNSGSGSYSDVIAGIDYVAAEGAPGDVANMSLGGGFSQAVNDAVIAAAGNGIRFSLAAGNSGDDANNYSPASANHANIWTVSASDSGDGWASFSNYGNPPIECAAPGVGVLSTYKDGAYETLSGTSMAAPHVAGILLFGNPGSDGTVSGDPDGDPDPICVN